MESVCNWKGKTITSTDLNNFLKMLKPAVFSSFLEKELKRILQYMTNGIGIGQIPDMKMDDCF